MVTRRLGQHVLQTALKYVLAAMLDITPPETFVQRLHHVPQALASYQRILLRQILNVNLVHPDFLATYQTLAVNV